MNPNSVVEDSLSSSLSILFMPMLATVIYALEYVIIEKFMSREDAPDPRSMCIKVGCCGCSVFSLYLVLFVLPNWQENVLDSIKEVGGSVKVVFISYFWVWLSNLGHNITYFALL